MRKRSIEDKIISADSWHTLHELLGSETFRLVWADFDEKGLDGLNHKLKDAFVKFHQSSATGKPQALKELNRQAHNERQRRRMKKVRVAMGCKTREELDLILKEFRRKRMEDK